MEKKRDIFEEMLSGYPDVLKISELQKIFGISRKYAVSLLEKGIFPVFKIANAYRVPKVCVLEYMRELQKEAEVERGKLSEAKSTDSAT